MIRFKTATLVVLLGFALGCEPTTSSKVTMPTALTTSSMAAAGRTPVPTPTGRQPPTLAPTPSRTPQNSPTPAVQPSQNTQYHLSVVFDYANHHLTVEEEIQYTNRSAEAIPDLLLVVEPARYPDVFRLNQLAWDNGKPVETHSRDLGLIRIDLPEVLRPGASIGLFLSYELYLPSPSPEYYGRPVPFGYSSRQTNLVDWYPFLPPYIPGEGWLAHPAGFFGEHLVYESSDFQVGIRLEGPQTGVTIASSAPAEEEGGWLRYRLAAARNFAWSASDQYLVSKRNVGGVTVLGYAFAAHAGAGEAALQATGEALELYSELFGQYPRQSLSVVEADFLDGMEYDGLYFLSKGFYNLYSGTPADYLIAIAAHETAHQWWYGLVGNDQADEPWLDEALSTYSERLFYERVHPEALDWWWTYRIHYYDPAGWVDGSIYNPEGYRAYRDAVYLNGALFLEDLRSLAGDEAFFAFLRDYARTYAHRISSTEALFSLFEKHSQVDLSSLLERYFQNHSE